MTETTCDTSIKTARDAFAGGALEVRRGPVDEGTGLSRLRLRPPAVAELRAQSQELGLGGLFGRHQPVNRAMRSDNTRHTCARHFLFLSKHTVVTRVRIYC